MNPCHFINLLQSICLVSKNTKFMRKVCLITATNAWTGWLGIINPLIRGLSCYEVPFFYIEHYQIGIINPLVLIYGQRYYDSETLSIKSHIYSHCFFSLYQRLILFPISEISLVNLNFTLCASMSKFCFL